MNPCDKHSGFEKQIEALEDANERMLSKIDDMSSKLDTLLGRLQPTLEHVNRSCDEISNTRQEIKAIQGEILTIKQQDSIYREEHAKGHTLALTTLGGSGLIAAVGFVAKLAGWL